MPVTRSLISVLVVALSFLPLAAYAGVLPAPTPETAFRVLESINCEKGPYRPRLPNSVRGFRALGDRLKEQIQAAGDYTGDPRTLTSANFWFDGMSASVVFRNQEPYGYFLEDLSYSHPHWNYLTPIKVGAKINAFLRKAKLPTIAPNTKRVQLCAAAEGAPDCIALSITRGRVSMVEYGCYTG